jgi:phage xkdN-like protein|nr:MAG TPA: tail assembly chaperone protein [Siphoviridae sp. ctjRi1]
MTIDFLMALDRDKLTEVPTERVRAKRLSEIAGEDVFVTVSALPGDRYAEISTTSVRNGKLDFSRVYDMQSLMVAEAVKDPDLKNGDLQRHFGAATPRDLARILFPGGEIARLADVVTELSGYSDDEGLVEQVKNS